MAVSVPSSAEAFWAAYGNTDLLVNIECEGPGKNDSLAAHVVDTYGLSLDSSSYNVGGSLYGLDIKRMDPMSVINLSLLEQMAESNDAYMYEAVVNPEGDIKFIEIGADTANLDDIYYQVQTSTYVDDCVGVLVRGGKPMPEWYDTPWLPIWGDGSDSSKIVFDSTDFMSNCSNEALSTHATIVFNDPHLDSQYKDGINNLYELEEPFLRIMGYATHKNAPGKTDDTTISWSNTALVDVVVAGDKKADPFKSGGPNIGTLVDRPKFSTNTLDYEPGCWVVNDQEIDPTIGIKVEMDEKLRFTDVRGKTVDKYQKIEEVYIFGYGLSYVKSAPYNNDSAAVGETPSEQSYKSLIYLDTASPQMYKLDPGEDYVVMHKKGDDGFMEPYIVFAKNDRDLEPLSYGQNTSFVVGQGGKSGRYLEGEEGLGCILPANGKGYLVSQVIALVSIDTPSIVIYDPEFNGVGQDGYSSTAINIAKNFEYLTRPLVLYEPPESVAFNGTLLDQTVGIKDNDPTTVQNFEDTPLEQALDVMSAGPGLEITLPFLNNPDEDDDKIARLSGNLYNFMNKDTGVVTTYVCGPNTEVDLGELGPGGGVVNSITYSYNDSSSYTISINEGSRMVQPLSGGGPSGPSFKATESVNARGTVIQALGNGVHFKVRLDGIGEKTAICTCHDVIREGDVVSCSIYNNPVEE